MGQKPFWQSKTLWVNVVGILAIVFGPDVIDTEGEAAILGMVNFVLRLITSSAVSLR